MNTGSWYRYRLRHKDQTLIHSLWISKGSRPDEEDIQDFFSPFVIEEYMYEGVCVGCENECCGQVEHMYCPSGCLHDKEQCCWCPLEFKNEM